MWFLALIIYLAVFPICYFVIQPVTLMYFKFGWFSWAAIAFGFSAFVSYFMSIFGPTLAHVDDRKILASLVRTQGTRWIAFMTVLLIGALAAIQILWYHSVPWGWRLAYVLPVIGVSCLNLLGSEWTVNFLKWATTPGRVVLPDRFAIDRDREPDPACLLKNFEWEYENEKYALANFCIRKLVYEKAKSEPRKMGWKNWADHYVINGLVSEIRQIIKEFFRIGMPYGSYKEVSFVLSFVQQVIEYQNDEGEYPKYPIETLGEEAGDCEDFSMLAAAILAMMGYKVALLHVPGHIALGVAGASDLPGVSVVFENHSYYYCEATAKGWKIGQLPDKYQPSQIEPSLVKLDQAKRIVDHEDA